MNSNKRAPKSLPTCGTIRGAQGLQVQLKNGLAGTKRYADLSAGDAPIAYQSSHPFHSPRVGASRCQTKKKKAGAALDPTHHQRGRHPERRSNPSAPRQGIKTASASRKIGRESSTLSPLTVLQIFRSVVDDPVAGCARSAPAPSPPRPGKADISADPELHRPHRPPPNLPTTIPLKRTVDVGHQPQRRPAGRCRSVCLRAHWNSAPPRARA